MSKDEGFARGKIFLHSNNVALLMPKPLVAPFHIQTTWRFTKPLPQVYFATLVTAFH